MAASQINVQSGRVTTEGDELYYEVRGHGTPLLMIAGGGGDGSTYRYVAELLADEYKVITYDRRANARSTRNDPQNFEISQQSRDAVAVIRAAGEESALVFGNSSGAVIALDMAKTQPQAVTAVVAHEPPMPRVLPDSARWQRFFARIYWMAWQISGTLALLRFALLLGIPVLRAAGKAPEPPVQRSEKGVDDFVIRQELLPITNYLPDVDVIRRNGIKVLMAAGQWSLDKNKIYARTAPVLAEKLGSEMITFPGHHGSFMDTSEEWAAALRSALHKAVG